MFYYRKDSLNKPYQTLEKRPKQPPILVLRISCSLWEQLIPNSKEGGCLVLGPLFQPGIGMACSNSYKWQSGFPFIYFDGLDRHVCLLQDLLWLASNFLLHPEAVEVKVRPVCLLQDLLKLASNLLLHPQALEVKVKPVCLLQELLKLVYNLLLHPQA